MYIKIPKCCLRDLFYLIYVSQSSLHSLLSANCCSTVLDLKMFTVIVLFVFSSCCSCLIEAKYILNIEKNGVLVNEEHHIYGPIKPPYVQENILVITGKYVTTNLEISALPQLTDIYIENSQVGAVPRAMTGLPNLKGITLFNNTYLHLPRGTFTNLSLEKIQIFKNSITSLENHVFNNLSKLLKIELTENNIKYWNPNAFINTPNVQILNLSKNLLTELPDESFINLNKITVLDLSHNKLSILHNNTFLGTTDFDRLDLSHNLLRTLPDKLLAPIFNRKTKKVKVFYKRVIKFIDFSYNHLFYLSRRILNQLTRAQVIHLSQNPLQCSCYFKLTSWALPRNISLVIGKPNPRQPICVVYLDECVEDTNEERLQYYLDNLIM